MEGLQEFFESIFRVLASVVDFFKSFLNKGEEG